MGIKQNQVEEENHWIPSFIGMKPVSIPKVTISANTPCLEQYDNH